MGHWPRLTPPGHAKHGWAHHTQSLFPTPETPGAFPFFLQLVGPRHSPQSQGASLLVEWTETQ